MMAGAAVPHHWLPLIDQLPGRHLPLARPERPAPGRLAEVRKKVRSHFEDDIRVKSRQLAELRNKAADIERRLSDARLSLERDLALSDGAGQAAWADPADWTAGIPGYRGAEHDDAELEPAFYAPPEDPSAYASDFGDQLDLAEERTEILVNHGRRTAARRGLARWQKVTAATGAAAIAITVTVLVLSGGGPSWPASVATVRGEIARACQNPDVKSEPAQVNFACAKNSSQILWVFALLTSGGNAAFADAKTGRVGLEPITPAQGGQIAWSLNLHHPYNPVNPIDSLQVAARAINNIVGGATVTGANGASVVQPGLESDPANCLRYTGSAAVTAPKGFPAHCTKPVASPAGQAALVADVYQKWVVGAPPQDAQDAAVLFANPDNPGDPQVQAILKQLPRRG